MTQCNEGHFYDEARYPACPYCSVSADPSMSSSAKTVAVQRGVGPTLPLGHGNAPEVNKTIPLGGAGLPGPTMPIAPIAAAAAASPKTVRLVRATAAQVDPVVGWLVAIEGPEAGQDYRLRAEKNFLGRDTAMDVALSRDEAVSRQKHATVVFEPQKLQFWLLPGDESGLVYLNGDVTYTPAKLAARDVIQVGNSKLMLMPFVDDTFRWPE